MKGGDPLRTEGTSKKAKGTSNSKQVEPKKKSAKELRRQKMQVRRKGKASEKAPEKSPKSHVRLQTEKNYRDFDCDDFENYHDYDNYHNFDNLAENAEVVENEKDAGTGEKDAGTEDATKVGQNQKVGIELDFLKHVPRKKMPLIRGETEDWAESGRNYVQF